MNAIPREATVVANCDIRAFPCIMTRPLAVLAQIVSADKKNQISVATVRNACSCSKCQMAV